MIVKVDLGDRSYEIQIESGLLSKLDSASIFKKYKKNLIITDANVFALYKNQIEKIPHVEVLVLPAGEETKSAKNLELIWDVCCQNRLDRKSLLTVFGGGVIGDLGGFAAATYMRGIDFVQIPTTLLSQVDSSVGGKTGINHEHGKNLIGAFYQPQAVLIDPEVLKTLPKREYIAGLGEVLKYGVIWDREFFDYLAKEKDAIQNLDVNILTKIIGKCCEIKAEVVRQDEREGGLRAILNYGHSAAHGLENVMAYKGLLHGEAVLVGMDIEMQIALARKMVTKAEVALQRQVMAELGLSLKVPAFDMQEYLDAIVLDKKNTELSLNFVLPTQIGKVSMVNGISFDEIKEATLASLKDSLFQND